LFRAKLWKNERNVNIIQSDDLKAKSGTQIGFDVVIFLIDAVALKPVLEAGQNTHRTRYAAKAFLVHQVRVTIEGRLSADLGMIQAR
jgi:hypothetical protein